MTTIRTFGPAANWDALGKLVADAHPLWLLPIHETLVFYDSAIVYIGKIEGDDSVYLRVVVDEDVTPDGADAIPSTITVTAHYLAFPSEEALKATLHDGRFPTLETYEKATSILREMTRHRLVAVGQESDCKVAIQDLPCIGRFADELPDRHLRPGGDIMEFTGRSFEELQAACGTHYVYPLPTLHTLVYFDCPRSWIGETRSVGERRIHLHTMVDEKDGWEVCYRLTFPDEASMRATLYEGYVATRETFRQATKIVREELTVSSNPQLWTLRVETLELDAVPEKELPPPAIGPCPPAEKVSK